MLPFSRTMPRALLSVSDKAGLVEFARGLADLGWELVSTGGTAKALRAAGLAVARRQRRHRLPRDDGRPREDAASRRARRRCSRGATMPEHMAALEEHDITPIDLVAVNLYPFRETVARKGVTPRTRSRTSTSADRACCGRPRRTSSRCGWSSTRTTTRACSPRFTRATTTSTCAGCSPARCSRTPRRTTPRSPRGSRMQREEKFPQTIVVSFERAQSLRYGENPGQAAAFYAERPGAGLAGLQAARRQGALVQQSARSRGRAARRRSVRRARRRARSSSTRRRAASRPARRALEAYRKALACDPVSAFGSVIAFTVPVDDATADAVSSLFVECIVAPKFSDGAVEILGRKKNLARARGHGAVGRRQQSRLQARARRRARAGARADDRSTTPNGRS